MIPREDVKMYAQIWFEAMAVGVAILWLINL